MSAVAEDLSHLLGCTVDFYFRAHGYHWNVEGEDFHQYHALFSDIYEEVYSAIDPLAENIRKLGEYAPFKLTTLSELSSLEDSRVAPNARAMALDLLAANDHVLEHLKKSFHIANDADEQGIANFIAERIDAHQKWAWQLKASTK